MKSEEVAYYNAFNLEDDNRDIIFYKEDNLLKQFKSFKNAKGNSPMDEKGRSSYISTSDLTIKEEHQFNPQRKIVQNISNNYRNTMLNHLTKDTVYSVDQDLALDPLGFFKNKRSTYNNTYAVPYGHSSSTAVNSPEMNSTHTSTNYEAPGQSCLQNIGYPSKYTKIQNPLKNDFQEHYLSVSNLANPNNNLKATRRPPKILNLKPTNLPEVVSHQTPEIYQKEIYRIYSNNSGSKDNPLLQDAYIALLYSRNAATSSSDSSLKNGEHDINVENNDNERETKKESDGLSQIKNKKLNAQNTYSSQTSNIEDIPTKYKKEEKKYKDDITFKKRYNKKAESQKKYPKRNQSSINKLKKDQDSENQTTGTKETVGKSNHLINEDTAISLNPILKSQFSLYKTDSNSSDQTETSFNKDKAHLSKQSQVRLYYNVAEYHKQAKTFLATIENLESQLEFAKYLIQASQDTELEAVRRKSFQKGSERNLNIGKPQRLRKKETQKSQIPKLAVYWINRLCKNQVAEAMEIKASWIRSGIFGHSKNHDLSLTYFIEAANLGSDKSALEVAMYYEAKKDYKSALEWYCKAGSLKNTKALYVSLGLKTDYAVAHSYLKLACVLANSECPLGPYVLGQLYMGEVLGRDAKVGFPLNPRLGINLLKKAAGFNHDLSCYKLGDYYQNGFIGVPINCKESIKYYEKGVENKSPDCMYALARIYFNGWDPYIMPSYDKAYKYTEMASEMGHPYSYLLMGMLHDPRLNENKIFVVKNTIKMIPIKSHQTANEWYKKAFSAGVEEAKELIVA
ncbi:hypothetical protein BB560_007241 [Smittium megazygosporum]|uniref:Uncharacterized protein n=1 Tax=Smittium megazygosporum TaxID=133381 RepID=A0A2T9XXR7_9FUNG|nr:hypothetical protein BB560_007241 [Smittium megazygosporum]